MHIVNNTGIEWRKGKLNSKLYMHQRIKTTVVPKRHKICEDVTGVRQFWCFNLFYFMYAMNILPRKLFTEFETSKQEDD